MTPAEVAVRAATLLRGGVPGPRVFALLAGESGDAAVVGEAAARVAEGEDTADALARADGPAWRVLAVAWRLASDSGAPLAAALERIGHALHSLDALRERRTVLLAGPRATVRLVTALGPLALVLGWLLGFNPLPVLLSPLGAGILAAGGLLLGAGVAWARALATRVMEADQVAGLEFELVGIVLSGGVPAAQARRRVVDATDRYVAEWVHLDAFCADAPVMTALATADAGGMPLGRLLAEEAQTRRTAAHAELERAAERLGVRVLIPLGVCVLPAFIVLGVFPILITMLGGL